MVVVVVVLVAAATGFAVEGIALEVELGTAPEARDDLYCCVD
jgi:hypothetical protein